jgi:hypothetical membrane protein
MNTQSVRQALAQLHPVRVRQHPMFQDPVSVATLLVTAIINVLTTLLLIVRLHRVDYPVPVHYLSLVGFDQVGSWFQNYRLVVFSVVVMALNALLAAKSYQRNRLASFFLLLGAAAVSILALVISTAFAVVV